MAEAWRVGVTAVAGRMGRALVQAIVAHHPELQLAAAIGRSGAAYLGEDAGRLAGIQALGLPVSADLAGALVDLDALIEFGPVEAALAHVAACVEAAKPVVVGTTGFSVTQRAELENASQYIPLVLAPNMSVGVNVLLAFLPAIIAALGEGYDVEIVEAHHRHKMDAPSGTALALGRAVAVGRGQHLDDIQCLDRNGVPGPRVAGSIGFATLRGADVVGEHTVWMAGAGERLELTHRAASRLNFAEGALRAASWLRGRAPGLYDMQDVLGLKDFAVLQ
ncbi:4-hydroxy-tetrahydrodipicolinate reductase [Acidithiobacillus ferriphilus]|uniref:4-hydroxy-tetrahydrodipicolinate reductase n=1 Tax=Acidithiobacillus ferriphilus TaxID=1689834 RepID=UPI00232EA4B4|nr:4-hydroxy-tetrahydrodipicolinate reductase [Acidithiobacillus ferriphilus]WCE94417.1 4-hydroxy-tetrahydrodipicolinate reductase [Acidithiobacillus ferriphilus]